MANNIHPTAIIDSKTEFDKVTIGPHVIIEKNVNIGEGTIINAGVIIKENSIIGNNNNIGEYSVLGGLPQDTTFDPKISSGIKIGDNNTLREYVTINRATKRDSYTTMGNNNYLMAVDHMGHDVVLHNNIIVANNTCFGGHVEVFDNAFVSANCGIHQFVRIGRNSMVGGVSKPSQDVPPFTTFDGRPLMFTGVNNIGLRRAGFSPAERMTVKRAYKTIYEKHSNISNALKDLKDMPSDPLIEEIILFIESSKRGIAYKTRS